MFKVLCGIGSVVTLTAGLALGAGYWLGNHYGSNPNATDEGEIARLLNEEREKVRDSRLYLERNLDALTREIGTLQARLMRIDALGSRLVKQFDLDDEEFDFSSVPPQGGLAEGGKRLTYRQMGDELAATKGWLESRAKLLRLLDEMVMYKEVYDALEPTSRPLANGWLSSRYGYRIDPINGKKNFHSGLDFAGKPGEEILAAGAGIVQFAGNQGGYGRVVEIRHVNGYVTRYAHNKQILVQKGEKVSQGQVIATLGSSGRATGPHLHFEVMRNGKTINPLEYLAKK